MIIFMSILIMIKSRHCLCRRRGLSARIEPRLRGMRMQKRYLPQVAPRPPNTRRKLPLMIHKRLILQMLERAVKKRKHLQRPDHSLLHSRAPPEKATRRRLLWIVCHSQERSIR